MQHFAAAGSSAETDEALGIEEPAVAKAIAHRPRRKEIATVQPITLTDPYRKTVAQFTACTASLRIFVMTRMPVRGITSQCQDRTIDSDMTCLTINKILLIPLP